MFEDGCVFFGSKVTVLTPSFGVGEYYTIDELTKAVFTLRSTDRTAEVLGGYNRARVDAPEFWEFCATLLEDGLTGLPVGLNHIAVFPGDLVVWVDTWSGVNAVDGKSLTGAACRSI